MAELTVDMTYGGALWSAAGELGKREQFLEETQQLAELMEREEEFMRYLQDPVVSAGEKKDSLKAVFEGRLSPELLNLLYVLVDESRMGRLQGILRQYKKLADEEEGVAYGKILTTELLPPEKLARFEEETSRLIRMKVSLTNEIDRSLIGGVKIFVDGRLIDASLRKRLDDMAETVLV